ncbi:MAG: hypothetical protein ACWA6X_07455 [Bauldia sp.]
MSQREDRTIRMSEDDLVAIDIEPGDPAIREALEALIRDEYQHCHPDDSLHALKHRAGFSKEAQGLLRDWMTVAVRRARREGLIVPPPRAAIADDPDRA